MTVLVLFIVVISLAVAQYCQSRDHTLNAREMAEIAMSSKKTKKQKPTRREMSINGQQSAYYHQSVVDSLLVSIGQWVFLGLVFYACCKITAQAL